MTNICIWVYDLMTIELQVFDNNDAHYAILDYLKTHTALPQVLCDYINEEFDCNLTTDDAITFGNYNIAIKQKDSRVSVGQDPIEDFGMTIYIGTDKIGDVIPMFSPVIKSALKTQQDVTD